MIQNEVAILRRVKHPNVVLLIEEVDTYSELYLVMELVKVSFYSMLPLKQGHSIFQSHIWYDNQMSFHAVNYIHYKIEREFKLFTAKIQADDQNPAQRNNVNLNKYK